MIDLHAHVLAGIDDGPAEVGGSVELGRAMERDGITAVAATPHLREDHPGVVPAELGRRSAELRERLAAEGLALEVIPAGEVDLAWAMSASEEDLLLATYGQRGTDLLVETPYGPLPATFERLLFELRARDLRLLLGHPERNPTFQRDPRRLATLVEQGVLLQLTASSLVRGGARSGPGRLATGLVEERLAHVIASDAHGPAVDRAPLSAGRDAAARVDPTLADWMVADAPAAIAAGEPLPPPPARGGGRRLRPPWRRRGLRV